MPLCCEGGPSAVAEMTAGCKSGGHSSRTGSMATNANANAVGGRQRQAKRQRLHHLRAYYTDTGRTVWRGVGSGKWAVGLGQTIRGVAGVPPG